VKLFSSNAVASNREAQAVSEIKRLDTVNKELTTKRLELIKLEADFVVALDQQTTQYEKEQAEHNIKVNLLKEEVVRLEERKKQALIPLEENYKKIDTKNSELLIKEAELQKREEEIEERAELLQEKLSDVSDREVQADIIAQKQVVTQLGIDHQKAQSALQAKEMSETMITSLAELGTRENAVSRRETTTSLKEKELIGKEEQLAKIETGFVNREIKLQDQYLMLERTTKEIYGRRT
jgi:chromosome segregation ATPase